MNLPSSTALTTSTTQRCDDCSNRDTWIIHTVRLRGTLRSFCTNCLLRNHPTSFCPCCFAFYDSSPPHSSRRVSCVKCYSVSHAQCVPDSNKPSYLCPPCQNPNSFSYFRPIIRSDGTREIDKSLADALLCAARIASSSMNKAVSAARSDADRRAREAALARKRAREALEHVVTLAGKEKSRSVIPRLKEASVEISGSPANRPIPPDLKPKPVPTPVSNNTTNGAVKETESSATTTTTPNTNSGQLKNNGFTEKQSAAIQTAIVKQEGDDTSK